MVYVTAPATFDGDVAGFVTAGPEAKTKDPMVGVGAAVQATQTVSAEEPEQTGDGNEDDDKEAEDQTTQEPKAHTTEQQETLTADEEEPMKTEPAATNTNNQNKHQTTLSTATAARTADATREASTTNSDLGHIAAATSGSSASDTASSGNLSTTSKDSSSGDMGGGAKAGIAIGAVLGVALIAALAFFLVRKKKQNQKMREIEDEKVFGNLGPLPEPQSPPMPEPRTPEEPPQLDVRPVTQFAPFGMGNAPARPGSAGAGAGTAGGAAAHQSPSHSPESSTSRKDPFGDPVNPFENRTEPPSPAGASRSVSPPDASGPGTTQSGPAPEASPAAPAAAVGAVATGAVAGAVASKAKTAEKDLPLAPEPDNAAPKPQQPQDSTGPGPSRALTPDAISVASSNGFAAAPVVAPAGTPSPGPLNVHRVQMDFTPSMGDELPLRSGQLIRLLHEYDDGWALCVHLNGPQQGVAPRSCLSARPVKPRPRGPPGAAPGPRGPPLPCQSPRFYPASDGQPGPFASPMSPARSTSPARPGIGGSPAAPFPQRPMSPGQFPTAARTRAPGIRQVTPRSMSPGPYGPPGMPRPQMPVNYRTRSNSAGGAAGPKPLAAPMPQPSPGEAHNVF